MNANELFSDVFSKTKELLTPCVVDEENSQSSNILEYLLLFACYLSGKEEAEIFQKFWLEIKEDLRKISDPMDFLNQTYMMEKHIGQSLKEESVHKPGDSRNLGIYHFYKNKFPSLYKQAQEEKEKFWKKFDAGVKETQDYVEKLTNDHDFFEQEVRKNPGVWFMLD